MSTERDRRLQQLLGMIAATRDDEMPCDDCLAELARFAESELERPVEAYAPDDVLERVRLHLMNCPECDEEYATLRKAMAALDEGPADDVGA